MNTSVRETGGTFGSPGEAPQNATNHRSLDGLRRQAMAAWCERQPDAKCQAVAELGLAVSGLELVSSFDVEPASVPLELSATGLTQLDPGRPDVPTLVHPSQVARRRPGSTAGRAAMLHAIAHIEFNAINLALDAVWRFASMPAEFVADWISVAVDEARHYQMLTIELAHENYLYGDFDAHDGLWAMARKTASDCQARMAIVPRVMEARGLDATPVIQGKLRRVGDSRGVELLQMILDEEIRHVRIGDYWFRRISEQLGQPPEVAFRSICERYEAPRPHGPINREARLAAGFSDEELRWLSAGRTV